LGSDVICLQRRDPALHDYVTIRFPALAGHRFGSADAHVYRVSRHVAERFWAPGAALVGDSAHATHPAGATGMSLAVTGAERLADLLAPALRDGSTEEIDRALRAYDAERRPAAVAAVESNHLQALRLWQSDLFRDPRKYAEAVNPSGAWGAGGAGWGQDPAALRLPSNA
jgi:2-polyprenyl-6-methoxyphenol hydroxylase-like FAD-dependent oxidoreductase